MPESKDILKKYTIGRDSIQKVWQISSEWHPTFIIWRSIHDTNWMRIKCSTVFQMAVNYIQYTKLHDNLITHTSYCEKRKLQWKLFVLRFSAPELSIWQKNCDLSILKYLCIKKKKGSRWDWVLPLLAVCSLELLDSLVFLLPFSYLFLFFQKYRGNTYSFHLFLSFISGNFLTLQPQTTYKILHQMS